MYNVPIVTVASTYTNINKWRSLIIAINETFYYGEKLGHYMINPNQFQSYGTMVWEKPFDSNRELYVETKDGDTIDLIANGTNIGFHSIAPTEHALQSLPHVHPTSKFKWNPETVHLGEFRADAFKEKYR